MVDASPFKTLQRLEANCFQTEIFTGELTNPCLRDLKKDHGSQLKMGSYCNKHRGQLSGSRKDVFKRKDQAMQLDGMIYWK